MFALKAVPGFNLLCIPPLTREQDVGLSTLMLAARFCADQHAMLVVDPPLAWSSAQAALEGAARLAAAQRERVHVFPARAGVRSAARPARDLRLLRRGRRHDRALR